MSLKRTLVVGLRLLSAVCFCVLMSSSEAVYATVTFSSNDQIAADDDIYDGEDIVVDGCVVTINGAHSFNSLQVINGGVVTHSANGTERSYWLELDVAADITIDSLSQIDVSGCGYGPAAGPGAGGAAYYNAGGGHGGEGGYSYNNDASGGIAYGNILQPITLGSGGGNSNGGAGGGAISLTVAGMLNVSGSILATGGNGSGHGGGGAGGSIYLSVGTLAGAGQISANGGDPGNANSGGGSGGRIAVRYATSTFTGTYQANGASGYQYGAAGTIYTKADSADWGNLIVRNTGTAGAWTPLTSPEAFRLSVANGAIVYPTDPLNIYSLSIWSGGLLTHPSDATGTEIQVAGDATIADGGALDVSARGYGPASGPGAGSTAYWCGGGAYGGNGGDGYPNYGIGGAAYGNIVAPTDLGSGGGETTGGRGGGAIRLVVDGTLNVDGTLLANGQQSTGHGGGGAGGSIYLTVGSLSGAGVISANGGASANGNSGGGSGGRIAIEYGSYDFLGTLEAIGASGYQQGGPGTVYTTAGDDGVVRIDNVGASGAWTPLTSPVAFAVEIGSGAIVTPNGLLTIASLVVEAGGTLTHPADVSGTEIHVASDVTIADGGTIDVSARGAGPNSGDGAGGDAYYCGGGAHGGNGGNAHPSYPSGGLAYGNVLAPTDLGSGGGGSSSGGRGGGAIRLVVGDSLDISGTLLADGQSATGHGGGGAGGSIYLTVGALTGTGLISASGGNAGHSYSGGGAGGRIAIEFEVDSFAGTCQAVGASGYSYGGAGTIYKKQDGPTTGELLVDNGGNKGVFTPLTSPVDFNVTIANGAVAYPAAPLLLENLRVASGGQVTHQTGIDNVNVTVNTDATIETGGAIDVSRRGYAYDNGPGVGTSAHYGGGAAHGGNGGDAWPGYGVGGSGYDSILAPSEYGSGGGRTDGGYGGGTVRLVVGGILQVDGLLAADGGNATGNGGGGAGGSLYLTTNTLSGSGNIQANGGNSGHANSGGGAGGRISIEYTNGVFNGISSVFGGSGYYYGAAGTIYTYTEGDGAGHVLIANNDNSGAWTRIDSPEPFNVSIADGAIVYPQETLAIGDLNVLDNGLLTHPSGDATFNINVQGDATVSAAGAISANGKGYGYDSGPGAGQSAYYGGGGGYGGRGGDSVPNYGVGGAPYGMATEPLQLGSGGGRSDAGVGGGLIRLTVSDVLSVDGTISANGVNATGNGGGGSGGSVYLTVGSLAGSGQVTATGGNSGHSSSGGGGGGRIAVYTADLQMDIAQLNVAGGTGYNAGQVGTIFIGTEVPLRILSMSPDDVVDHVVDHVDVQFNRTIDPTTFTVDDVVLLDTNGAEVTLTVDPQDLGDGLWRISFPTQTADGDYEIQVGPQVSDNTVGEMDQDGDGVPGEPIEDVFVGTFGIDRTLPEIVAQEPTGTVTTSIDYVDLTFSEPVFADRCSPSDISLIGPNGAVDLDAPQAIADDVWRITFVPQVSNGDYTLTVNAGCFRDQANNALSTDYTGGFTIAIEPGSRVLFITVDGGYDNEGANMYQTVVNAGANATYAFLSAEGQVADMLNSNGYDQVWVYDLSSAADTYDADWQAIADWYNARSGAEIICDSRFLSSYWNGRWTGEGQNLSENYYHNLKQNLFGGLVLATDHDGYQGGINTINSLIGIQPFCCNFSLPNIPVDTEHPLMTTPNDMGVSLYDDSSPGQAPYGLQANGRILYSVAWHSNNPDTPGISSTIEGGIGFHVDIVSPADGAEFYMDEDITFAVMPRNGEDPISYQWSSDIDGQFNAITTNGTIAYSGLSAGTHTITVLAEDALSRDDDDSITLTVKATPDLMVTTCAFPTIANYRDNVEFSWTGLNDGYVAANGSWYDRVYLSSDQVIGSDTNLGAALATGPLDVALTHDGILNPTLSVTPGTYWVLIRADINNQIDEGIYEDNNALISDRQIVVRSPNLTVASVDAPESAYDGEPMNLSWTISNTGDGPAVGPWIDRVFISSNGELDGDDELLGEFEYTADLDAGTNAMIAEQVTIPSGLNGPYHFIVHTDFGNAVAEYDAENDNISSTADTTLIEQLELPDLEVTQLFTSDNLYIGQTFSVSWAVQNKGPGTASGSWHDRVYLSDDDALDTDPETGDVLVGQKGLVQTLGPDSVYAKTVSFVLPEPAGDYWLFVVLDAHDTIREEDELNNVEVFPFEILAPEYSATVSANIESAVAGTPVILSGSAVMIDGGAAAAEVDVDIRLTVRGMRRVFHVVTELDGTFSYTFVPLADEAGVYTVSADHPAVEDDDPEDTFTLYGLRASPYSRNVSMIVGDTVEGTIQLRNLGDTPLTGLQAVTSDVPANLNLVVNAATGVDSLGTATATYSLTALDSTVPASTPRIEFTTTEGAAATFYFSVGVRNPSPALAAVPTSLNASMLRGEQTFIEFVVTNVGGAPTDTLQVQLPDYSWLSLSSPQTFGPLAPDDSATVVLRLNPNASLPLGPYSGGLTVSGTQCGVNVPFQFVAVSDATGDLRVEVTDEYSYYADGNPRVEGATITVKDTVTGAVVATGITDATGILLFEDLTEAYYDVSVTAPDHGSFRSTLLLPADRETYVEAFLQRELVHYEWTVVPVDVEDHYEITIEAEFETNVPAPVITIDPPAVDLAMMDAPIKQIDFVITNHGLIQADAARMITEAHPRFIITPLVDNLGNIPANSSVVVPTIIEDTEFGTKQSLRAGSCRGVRYEVAYDLVCGAPITYLKPVYFALPPSSCPSSPGSGTGGGGIYLPPGGGGGGTSSGGGTVWTPWSSPGSGFSSPMPCDPCDTACSLAIWDCLIGFIPGVGCPWGLFRSCSGLFGPVDPISCGLSIVGCIPAAGTVAGVIGCIYDIASSCGCLVSGAAGGGSTPPPDPVLRGAKTGNMFFPPIELPDGAPPNLAYFIERANRQLAAFDYAAYLYGDAQWLECPPEEAQIMQDWVAAYQAATEETSDEGRMISSTEHSSLLAMTLPSNVSAAMIDAFVGRWNRTIEYYDKDIFTTDEVPDGWSLDFIDMAVREAKNQAMDDAIDADLDEGFTEFMQSVSYARDVLLEDLTEDEEGFCATVRIQISQEAVVTRSGFEATLVLENGGDVLSLDYVDVEVTIQDEDGIEANDLFGLLDPVVSGGLSSMDGTQSLAVLSDATAKWIIVPSDEAAPTEPRIFYVGGTMRYEVDGELVEVPLYPVPITVYPNPSFNLKYFLEKIVYSDDPFTEDIVEPAVPFSLGLLVINEGAGEAKNLSITSAQPEIIENEHGLLIDFTIIGTQIGFEQRSPSLTAEFGQMDPGESKVARWLMTSSLEGEFKSYEATFEQQGPLGQLGLSLIDNIEIHEMNHVMRIDDPTDDGLPDFLVNDTPDIDDLPDRIHSSDGTLLPVTAVLDGITDGQAVPGDMQVELAVTMPAEWAYIRVDDPSLGKYRLVRALRSDGRDVLVGDNAWTTYRIDRPDGQPPVPESWLHLIDLGGTGQYTLFFEPWTPEAPSVGTVTATTVELLDVGAVFEGTVLHAVQDENSGLYVGPDGRTQTAPSWRPLENWTGVVVWALEPETEYRFRSKARPGGVETDFGTSTVVVTHVQGDVNGDSSVSLADKTLVEDAFGSTPERERWDPRCDLNGDQRVSTLDRRIVQIAMSDRDQDADVDLRDFAVFQACFTGTGMKGSEDCLQSDTDRDGDVDLADFAELEVVLTGPG